LSRFCTAGTLALGGDGVRRRGLAAAARRAVELRGAGLAAAGLAFAPALAHLVAESLDLLRGGRLAHADAGPDAQTAADGDRSRHDLRSDRYGRGHRRRRRRGDDRRAEREFHRLAGVLDDQRLGGRVEADDRDGEVGGDFALGDPSGLLGDRVVDAEVGHALVHVQPAELEGAGLRFADHGPLSGLAERRVFDESFEFDGGDGGARPEKEGGGQEVRTAGGHGAGKGVFS